MLCKRNIIDNKKRLEILLRLYPIIMPIICINHSSSRDLEKVRGMRVISDKYLLESSLKILLHLTMIYFQFV